MNNENSEPSSLRRPEAKRPMRLGLATAIMFTASLLLVGGNALARSGQGAASPVAETRYGVIEGLIDDEAEILLWKGVPYARPPVGELRWRAPQPPERWSGLRPATESASPCVQALTSRTWIRQPRAIGSEDCLYLDIYRPHTTDYKSERLPVYVWIHGGSNNFGSAASYDARNLATHANAVIVVVQYRLGALGWFNHPAVLTGGEDVLTDSGNFGTLDNVAALRWVQDNIARFGGDPGNVTIGGVSAGAHNVLNMTISDLGSELFHKAVSQTAAMPTRTPEAALKSSREHVDLVILYSEDDVETVDQAVARRKAMEADGTLGEYLRTIPGGDFYMAILKYGRLSTYPAIQDGMVIPEGGVISAYRSGNYNRVPIILGANRYETKPFAPLYGPAIKHFFDQPSGKYSWFNLRDVMDGNLKEDGTPFTVDDVLPTETDRAIYEMAGYYGGRNWRAKYVDELAQEMARHQRAVYAYSFGWGGIGSGPSPYDFIYGGGHAMEIPFFFGRDESLFGYAFTSENEAGRRDLQQAMMTYLANFFHGGDPNGEGLVRWAPWSNQQGGPSVIDLDADFHRARIRMLTERLTVKGVGAERKQALDAMAATPGQRAAVNTMSFYEPWPEAE